MITLFTIPKAFVNKHTSIIQENAITSWSKIPNVKVILYGNDEGVFEFAKKKQIEHLPINKLSSLGTPLLSEAFNSTIANNKNSIIGYVNSDIIITKEINEIIDFVSSKFDKWVLVGRRIDLDINSLIQFDQDWEHEIKLNAKENGKLHGHSGIDYFIFPSSSVNSFPDFVVGRPSWDNWFIYYFLNNKIPVIDCTNAYNVIHQNHPRSYQVFGAEGLHNFNIAGGTINLCSIRHCNYKLERDVNLKIRIRKNFKGVVRFTYLYRLYNSKRLNLINLFLKYIKKV